MKVLPCSQTVFCDVDDTLVMWHRPAADDPDAIEITCPTSSCLRAINEQELGWEVDPTEVVTVREWTERLKPHKKHIEQLKKHKLRGHTVIVWSAGGWEWAEAVVRALKLEQYVDLVIEKPTWVYDDLPPNEYMPKSQWLKDE